MIEGETERQTKAGEDRFWAQIKSIATSMPTYTEWQWYLRRAPEREHFIDEGPLFIREEDGSEQEDVIHKVFADCDIVDAKKV